MSPRRARPASSPPGFFGTLFRLSIVGSFLFVAAGVAGYATIYMLVKTPETQAPELLTLTLEDAVRAASAEGFALRVAGSEPSTAVEKGRVVSQRPLGKEWVKSGGTIVVVVSE